MVEIDAITSSVGPRQLLLGCAACSECIITTLNFLRQFLGLIGVTLLGGEMSKKWSRRSCPPLLQYNGLCPDHFDHSQEVIRHVSTVSTIMYYKRGSQFPCSLECKIMRIHGRMYQKPFYTVLWEKCWAGAITTGTFVFMRERENQFIRRQGERRETASNVCDKLIALQFRFDVCTGIPQYKVSRESFLVVCIGQMHSLSLITLQFAFDVAWNFCLSLSSSAGN